MSTFMFVSMYETIEAGFFKSQQRSSPLLSSGLEVHYKWTSSLILVMQNPMSL